MKRIALLTAILMAMVLFIASCSRTLEPDSTFISGSDIQLKVSGRVIYTYDPLTWQGIQGFRRCHEELVLRDLLRSPLIRRPENGCNSHMVFRQRNPVRQRQVRGRQSRTGHLLALVRRQKNTDGCHRLYSPIITSSYPGLYFFSSSSMCSA